MAAMSNVDNIAKSGDHSTLAKIVERSNILSADVSGEDFDFHSSDLLVKLFKVCQLSLEVSNAKISTLSSELNDLNRIHQRKIAEAKNNEKNLRRQDEEVAMLRDELYRSKEALKEAEEHPSVTRIDPSIFPSQERRVDSTSTTHSAVATQISNPNEIKLHIVSLSHGLYIPLKVDAAQTIRNLQNKVLSKCFLDGRCSIDFEEWSLHYKDQELQSMGTLKEYKIVSESALVILPTSTSKQTSKDASTSTRSTIESKLDNIKSKLDQIAYTLECQAATQESSNEVLLNGCDYVSEEAEPIGDIRSTRLNASESERNSAADGEQDVTLKVDTSQTNDKANNKWLLGLNFDVGGIGPPTEIKVTKVDDVEVKKDAPLSSTKTCSCEDEEVCDECIQTYSSQSAGDVALSKISKKNVPVLRRQFTFSAFDENYNIENDTVDYDYSCDKSEDPSLQIGAKQSNLVKDADLQSIEVSFEEFAISKSDAKKGRMKSSLGLNGGGKKKLFKKLSFMPKWKKLKNNKKATPMDF
jgi:hypothetical protein